MEKIDRRTFIRLTMLGAPAAALVSGCGIDPRTREQLTGQYGGMDEHAYPYVVQPDLQDGLPQWYATTCRMCNAGCGLIVRTLGGRAVKVEGNPDHPVNRGATCARAQASLQSLYNPGRLRFPVARSGRAGARSSTDWDTVLARLASELQARRGRTAILVDAGYAGPTMNGLVDRFAAAVGAQVFHFGQLDDAPWRAACDRVYGMPGIPAYPIDEADYLLSFNANLLEAWPSPVYYGRLFGEFRQGARRKAGDHGRFVYVGPRMSMTAARADSWLPCRPGTEGAVALGVLNALGLGGIPVSEAAGISGVAPKDIASVSTGFSSAGKQALAVGGDGSCALPNATETLTAVEALNAHSGIGISLTASVAGQLSYCGELRKLQSEIESGAVNSLVVIGQPNPVFSIPASVGFANSLSGLSFMAALTPFEDETTAFADLILPVRTFLEDWQDDTPHVEPPGFETASLVQPVIDPQYIAYREENTPTPQSWMETRPIMEVLTDVTRRLGADAPDNALSALRGYWAGKDLADLSLTPTNDTRWTETLSQGGSWTKKSPASTKTKTRPVTDSYNGVRSAPVAGSFYLCLYPHLYWSDGRHANLPWLQEITDPMSAAVWNSWVEINLQVAESLGIRTGDIVRLTTDQGSIELPALPFPAIHPEAVAVPMGQGHVDAYGLIAAGRGANPMSIASVETDTVTGAMAYGVTPVTIAKVRSAESGYRTDINTLVILNDLPNGQEPDAVMGLIHETAAEARAARQAS